MGDSQKKRLTADQKARLANDVSIAFKQMEDEERKKQNLKRFCDKLVKENHELKAINDALVIRLAKVEKELVNTNKELKEELSDTKKELSDTKTELTDVKEKAMVNITS